MFYYKPEFPIFRREEHDWTNNDWESSIFETVVTSLKKKKLHNDPLDLVLKCEASASTVLSSFFFKEIFTTHSRWEK